MKRLITAFYGLTLAIIFTHPSYGCEANHGYTKTAQLVQKSSLSSKRKNALIKEISESKSNHDLYTMENNYAKMHKSVQKLLDIRHELEQ